MKKPNIPSAKDMDPEELALFRDSMADVRPMGQDRVVHKRPKPQKKQTQVQQARREADHFFSDTYQPALPEDGPMRYVRDSSASYELKKLRRGDYTPDLLLDLHGYTQAEARHEIIALLKACQRQHVPCASVMHGLGTGVLKRQVPAWLAQHPDVIAFHQAPLEWGGNGALLVLVDIGLDHDELMRR